MNHLYNIALCLVLLCCYPYANYAQDTTLNRVVTVERDYQPLVQDAQAISVTPSFIVHNPQPNPVVYSTYSEPLSVGYNLHALPASQTNFRKETPLAGHVEAAVGHRNSHLLFGYQTHKKNNRKNQNRQH